MSISIRSFGSLIEVNWSLAEAAMSNLESPVLFSRMDFYISSLLLPIAAYRLPINYNFKLWIHILFPREFTIFFGQRNYNEFYLTVVQIVLTAKSRCVLLSPAMLHCSFIFSRDTLQCCYPLPCNTVVLLSPAVCTAVLSPCRLLYLKWKL